MADEKRKRCSNWLPSEKQLLLDLVEQHFAIIECKKTDGVTMKTKLAGWTTICNEYNSQTTNCCRTAENLKALWESLKKAARKEESSNRLHMIQTGGGPPKAKKSDPFHDRVISLIKTSATGLDNPFDSDSVIIIDDSKSQTDVANSQTDCEDIQSIKIILESEPNNPPSSQSRNKNRDECTMQHPTTSTSSDIINEGTKLKDWSDYSPQLLKTPISTNLKEKKSWTSRRRPAPSATASSLALLHKKKIDAIEIQQRLAADEIEQSKQITEIEIEIKKEQLKQEKLRTRLLIFELRQKKKSLI